MKLALSASGLLARERAARALIEIRVNRVPSFTIVGLVESRRRRNSPAAFLLRYRASRFLSGVRFAFTFGS